MGTTGRHAHGRSPGFMATRINKKKKGQTRFGLTISFGPWSPADATAIGPVAPISCRLFCKIIIRFYF